MSDALPSAAAQTLPTAAVVRIDGDPKALHSRQGQVGGVSLGIASIITIVSLRPSKCRYKCAAQPTGCHQHQKPAGKTQPALSAGLNHLPVALLQHMLQHKPAPSPSAAFVGH